MNKWKKMSVTALMGIGLVLIGCNGQSGESLDSRTLTVGFEGDVVSMDPHASNVLFSSTC